ncbi:MAG TPA: phosphonate ABC transporter ATP-binding protein, partial [Spirochaetia bacterium]|nr:phosphonate ABC transporter ATP-binding protein [Spirochaetia bacterium]
TSKVIMDYLSDICRNMGITLVISLHQVDVALKYSHRVIGFNRGSILYDGSPAGLTRQRIDEIYGSEPAEFIARQAG